LLHFATKKTEEKAIVHSKFTASAANAKSTALPSLGQYEPLNLGKQTGRKGESNT
jgi:hypothetical protein